MKPDTEFYYPNRMGRIILESMEEVVGKNGLNHVLNLSGRGDLIGNYPPFDAKMDVSFATIGGLMTQLENAYGPRGGRGLAIRTGRVAFKYGIREFGQQIGLMETTFRLLPLGAKIRMGGQALADLFNQATDQRVSIKEEDGKLLWVIERCPLCWERHSEDAVCHLAVGLLQESLYWVSGGKIFNVEETLCIAKGDPTCTIEVGLTPLA
ncbi:MAG: 4-vinyl reductase [Chloroflexota bacterium]